MPVSITASVGERGENRPDDVRQIFLLLNKNRTPPLVVSDQCSIELIQAIKEFQKDFLTNPDGRIDVGGRTWKELTGSNLEQASSSYKLRKDYVSLEVIHRHLALGMARPAVETLLGEADYSPIEGQYYYLSDRRERQKDAAPEQGEASVGLVLDYRNNQGELTDALQTFWLGVLGE